MELKKHGFWAALYRDCLILWWQFCHQKFEPRLDSTDLCTFVRTIFVWAPLVVIVNVAVCVAALYAAALFVWMLILNASTVGLIAAVMIGFGVVVGGLWLFFRGAGLLSDAVTQSETAQLAVAYVWARKQAICPMITFEENTNASA